MTIYWPTNTGDVIDSIRNVIGREVLAYLPTISGCYNCSLDPVTNTSINSFCPICHGEYWIKVFSGYSVTAHVLWGTADNLNWSSGGQIFEGDCSIQVKYTPDNLAVIASGEYYKVDGKILYKDNIAFRGAPTPNRIIIRLKEKDDE
jgi:hypothetical protein